MEHKVVPAYKIFEEISSGELEKQVNKFAECHDVESVNFRFNEIDQDGMMLCDRPNKYGKTFTLYRAIVKYRRDITEELVSENLMKWAWETVESGFKDYVGGGHCNLNTLEWTPVADLKKQKLEQLLASDEARAMQKTLENKFCREALEVMTPDKKGDEGQCKNL